MHKYRQRAEPKQYSPEQALTITCHNDVISAWHQLVYHSGASPIARDAIYMANGNWIAYDGDCPFCSAYVRMLRLQKAIGPVALINCRESLSVRQEVSARGFDLDQGMVLKLNGHYYYGADCIHTLALLTSPSSLFNRLNGWVFGHAWLSRSLYPVLKLGRAVVLKLLGRSRIGS